MEWRVVAIVVGMGCVPRAVPEDALTARPTPGDLAPRGDQVDVIFDTEVADPYRGLEDPDAAAPWITQRNATFTAHTDALEQKDWLYDRFQELWRYDDAEVRRPCLIGDREVWRTKAADQDKWVVHLADVAGGEGRIVVDPNTWDETDQLASFRPSPDCTLAVVGRSKAGNEDPVLSVLDLDTLTYADDAVRGWKQGGVRWKHDNSGFFYTSKPAEGEVPDGDHFYFHRSWWHTLGTSADADTLVLASDDDKNLWHGVSMSEDGRWRLQWQGLFNKNRLWIVDESAADPSPVAVIDDLVGNVYGEVVDDRLLLMTDLDAPHWRVMVADPTDPGQAGWTELIPEREDVLDNLSAVGGHLYATYTQDVSSYIVIFDLDGNELGQVPLPTRGSAKVSGQWGRPEVLVTFQSFAHPKTTYRFDLATSALEVVHESPIPVSRDLLDRIVVDQVWTTSKDGTRVPMFVVHDKDATGPVPTLLYGYGGFDVSLNPRFSTTPLVWIERGGAYAVANLRGGGEFGKAWHEAGMREQKQNVFDDFLSAATWLVEEGWTTPEQLAISGGSNGGLLVSAAVTQAPDRFGAVLCSVPLTDMIRFHRFGIADVWTEEYGSADDPEMFPHLFAYSPYHAVRDGTDYPAILVVGSSNDARTDPIHATKFAAAIRHADQDRGTAQPILLSVQGDSGHRGGVTIDTKADQSARHIGFLMSQVGL